MKKQMTDAELESFIAQLSLPGVQSDGQREISMELFLRLQEMRRDYNALDKRVADLIYRLSAAGTP